MSKDFNGASKGRSTFGLFYRFLTMMLMSVYNVLNAALHLFYVLCLCDGALSERSQMFRVIKKKKKLLHAAGKICCSSLPSVLHEKPGDTDVIKCLVTATML